MRDIDVAVADLGDGDQPIERRVRALWSLEGAHALTSTSSGTLVSVIGALLAHPQSLVAREAYEVLCALEHDDGGIGELSVAVGVTRSGRLAVSPRSFTRCERLEGHPVRAWCPDLDVEVVPLVDVHRLQERVSAPLALLAGMSRRTALVVFAHGHGHGHGQGHEARAHFARMLGGGRLARDAGAPRAWLEQQAWRVDGDRLFVDGVDTLGESVLLTDHHELRWAKQGGADVVVVPLLTDSNRTLVETPDGAFHPVAWGDAWFSTSSATPLARGHIAIVKGSALVVDRSVPSPVVTTLKPGEACAFGAYEARYDESGAMVHIEARVDTGPTRARPALKQSAAAAAKKAA